MPYRLKMQINDCIYGVFQKIYKPVYKSKNKETVEYLPVLAFHWFLPDEKKNSKEFKDNRWYASINNFEEQLQWLKQHGYHTLTCGQFYEWICGKTELTGKPVLLTFDDGEWSQLNLAMPLLEKYGYHGICFVIGKHFSGDASTDIPTNASEDTVAYFTKEQFDKSEYAGSAMEIGSHTYNLHYLLDESPAASVISDEDLRLDMKLMQQVSSEYVAMPYGGYGQDTESVLSEGYKLGFAIDRVGNPYASRKSRLYAINRILVDGRAGGDFLDRYLY